ncbi:tellurite resistance TerB family protein [Tellurirhabdus rosea]|uniref:tellurite resistance TerB family protein n=1 Tax=Tellurirhabdus rosea TaxID=2674997 RepID=UPI002254148F|nr:TerB family tellurite resistance protein [Tellurirhabdus rosea]
MEAQSTTLLKDYSIEERSAYLAALATMANADGNVSDEEIEFLNLLAEAAELPENLQQEVVQVARNPSQISLQRCLDTLKPSQLRFSFITDIISFAKADGQYTPEEEQQIHKMADYLGVDQQQFSILDRFVDKADEARQQGQDPTSPQFLNQSGFGSMFQKAGISPNMVKGMLGVLAPIVISSMLSRGKRRHHGGGMLGGLLGGLMGGGSMMGGGHRRGGGLGSLISILGGLSGRPRYGGMRSGGLGGLLGSILGGRRGW